MKKLLTIVSTLCLYSILLAAPPSAIVDLQIEYLDSSMYQLSWSPPTTDINGQPVAITGYRIYASQFPYFDVTENNCIDSTISPTETSYLIPEFLGSSGFFKITTEGDSLLKPEVTLIPADAFTMGSDEVGGIAIPEHEVLLTQNFYLGQSEVTNAEYMVALQWAYNNSGITNLSATSNSVQAYGQELLDLDDPDSQIAFENGVFSLEDVHNGTYAGLSSADHPVMEISWYGAACYCDWLSLVNDLPPFYDGDWSIDTLHNPYEAEGYRLPMEAEWEFAARYNDGRRYPWGNDAAEVCVHANYNNCVGWTAPKGSFPAGDSEVSLSDMSGNLWEWINDWSGSYSSDPQIDPLGPENGSNRMLRGAAWDEPVERLQCAFRISEYPYLSFHDTGFRICKKAESFLMAHYPLDGNGTDLSGNDNHATINGGVVPVADRFGYAEQACVFDGSSGYLVAPDSPLLQPDEAMTMSAWIYPTDVSGSRYIVNKAGSPIHQGYHLRVLDGKISFSFGGYDHDFQTPTAVISPDQSWYHIVVIHDGTIHKVYLDGELLLEDYSTNSLYSSSELLIGRHQLGDYFSGTIDDLRLYSRALSEHEILNLYHAGGWPE